MSSTRAEGVEELAREYQDYVIAHRVRTLIGGKLEPKPLLALAEYASTRLERQRIAREIVTVKPLTAERLQRLDRLTDELCFGMWRNPREINDFLRAAWRAGGHPVFESDGEFAGRVLSDSERSRLPEAGLEVARYYRSCLSLGAAALNPDEMEFAASRVDDLAARVPLYLAEFTA